MGLKQIVTFLCSLIIQAFLWVLLLFAMMLLVVAVLLGLDAVLNLVL